MQLRAPFVLGPFTVDGQGRLQPTDAREQPGFSVRWRGCEVRVRFEPSADGAVMVLHTSAGRVPSTAASGCAGRAAVFAMLAALPGLLPSGWRLDLLADHRLELAGRTALALPATASELLCAMTGHLLAAGPYLDLLGEAGLEAPGLETGGRVNICPG